MRADPELHLPAVRRLRVRPAPLGLSIAGLVASLAAAATVVGRAASGGDGESLGAIAGFLLLPIIASLLATLWFAGAGKRAEDRATDLRWTGAELLLDGRVALTRDEIAGAAAWKSGDAALVRIERRGLGAPSVVLQLGSLAEARALVRALGQAGGQVRRSYRIAAASTEDQTTRLRTFWGGLVTSVVLLVLAGAFLRGTELAPAAPALFVAGYLALMLQWFLPARLTVGADGIDVRWLWRRRFIPLAQLARAEVTTGEERAGYANVLLRLHQRTGGRIDVPVQMVKGRAADAARHPFAIQRAAEIAERVEQAIAAAAGTPEPDVPGWQLESLDRGPRDIASWIADLRDRAAEGGPFRRIAEASHEALWSVLEDGRSPPERRAAAAVALGPHLDDAGRERLRIAAAATAAPRLRIALEAAAVDDRAAVEEALGALDEDRPARALDAPGR